ncbi:hypothetical protein IQ241_14830 [Romeria aff. gracilis LEGE 07310]|uniref:Antitoxin-like ribbon-helix-helix domain-containing protein n=1 Tax=Vasconcelosia minhoensis LEGE 07310 TaxID=915328 RepID=A0A8J7AJ60_9CYAN|nr:ribbon-helix-helix domain-containing protein [Romeria gracilis]MBE9078553.1 hypothetical protein [Romeria aff. gracilis LEGE 07310]
MAKKSNSAAAPRSESKARPEAAGKVPGQSEASESAEQKPYQAPSRAGKKAITGHFEPEVSKQLKLISLEEDTSVQALLGEALNDLFTKYGKPPIA